PRAGLGFEEEVATAVKDWRFNAVAAGSPKRQIDGIVRYAFGGTLPGEYMVGAPPRDVWKAVREVVDSLHLKPETLDDANQFIVTRPNPYNLPALPGGDKLQLGPQLRESSLQLHVYVAPAFEPARIAIGSVIGAGRSQSPVTSSSPRYGATIYGHTAIAQWFFDQLVKRLGAKA